MSEQKPKKPSQEYLNNRFKELVDELGILSSKNTESRNKNFRAYYGLLATWIFGVNTESNRKYVGKMYRGQINVRAQSIIMMQLMLMLKRQGFDLTTLELDQDYEIERLDKNE